MFRKPFGRPPRLDAAPSRAMAADIHEALARLLPRWQAMGVEPLPPVPASDVRGIFARLGAFATPDVVLLYGAIGGMRDMDDDSYLRLWPLDEIAAQPRSDRGVEFADYLISCWGYRLSAVSEDQSAVRVEHYDDKTMRVGPTLEAFLITLEHEADFLHGLG